MERLILYGSTSHFKFHGFIAVLDHVFYLNHALHQSLQCFQIAACLIDHGCSVNQEDAVKFTPLHIACNFGHEKVS